MFRLPFFKPSPPRVQPTYQKPSFLPGSDYARHETDTEANTPLQEVAVATATQTPGTDPLAPPTPELDWEQFTLVAKTDIYYNRGNHPVLLLKAGQSINVNQISKLVKFGVQPHQFLLSEDHTSEIPQEIFDNAIAEHYPQGMSPVEGVPSRPLFFQKGAKDKILIQDSDERSIKRLSDCLTGFGVPLPNIHPVTIRNHLCWTIERYEPHVLFIDASPFTYASPNRDSLSDLMSLLKSYPFIREVVLTASIPSDQDQVRQDLQDLGKYYGAKVLFKPVNRFALSEVLSMPLSRQ